MMYGAMADYARAQARIMVFGIVIPAASFLGGLGLMALGAYDLSVFAVALAGLLLSLVFVGVTRRQNRAYVEALLEMLEAKVGAAAAGASAAVCGIAERVRGRCPGWAGRLPGLVAAALADGRVDVLDNAAEAVCAVVPVREGVALREAVEGGAKRVAKG
jgi:hypothetical protein